MNIEELKDSVHVTSCGFGNYNVTVNYNGRVLTCCSHDSTSYDRIRETDMGIVSECSRSLGITYRQALVLLYNECLNRNGIIRTIAKK